MASWWKNGSHRWEEEQHALKRAGIRYEVDEAALASGKLKIKLWMEVADRSLFLLAYYPTHYPYFQPTVVAPDIELLRHQTPGTKQLCLLERGGQAWRPGTDTLASLLLEQLPLIFDSQPDSGVDEIVETRGGEPITGFISTEDMSFVGFPSYDIKGLSEHGTFRFGLESIKPLRGTVLELHDSDNLSIAVSEACSESYFEDRKLLFVTGRWLKLPSRPAALDAKGYFELAVKALPKLEQPRWETLPGQSKPRIDLVALLFEDELAWRDKSGNVIILSRFQQLTPKGERGKIETLVHRAELESRANYFVRDPLAVGLQKATVCLAGVGSIGSPAAKLLAQAGIGSLRMIDQDILDAGNAIRWEIGRSGAGHPKAHLLQRYLESNFPFTKPVGLHASIGNPMAAGDVNEQRVDEALFRGVTCLFDGSASPPVSQFLSETARSKKMPYIWMYATNGAHGGLVGRAGPLKKDFCWMCHLYYLEDGTIEALPSAPEETMVQPPGCLDPTFIGAQVDLTEISLMGTRYVMDEVMTCVGEKASNAYSWNIATLRLRDNQGRPQLPVWTPYTLAPHASCPNH